MLLLSNALSSQLSGPCCSSFIWWAPALETAVNLPEPPLDKHHIVVTLWLDISKGTIVSLCVRLQTASEPQKSTFLICPPSPSLVRGDLRAAASSETQTNIRGISVSSGWLLQFWSDLFLSLWPSSLTTLRDDLGSVITPTHPTINLSLTLWVHRTTGPQGSKCDQVSLRESQIFISSVVSPYPLETSE